MCVLVVLHRSVPDYPVVAAGDREEAYARQGEELQLLDDTPRIWGGRDPRAGGTWLALNEYGVVVGLTNRRERPYADNEVRSRGLLVLDLAHSTSAAEATERCVVEVRRQAYNGFNILCADPREVWEVQHTGHCVRYTRLEGVLHVVTNGEVDDRSESRIERACQTLEPVVDLGIEKVAPVIQRMLAELKATANESEADQSLSGMNQTLAKLADLWHPHIGIEERDIYDVEIIAGVMDADENVRVGQMLAEKAQQYVVPPCLGIPWLLYNLPPDLRAGLTRTMPPAVVEELAPVAWKAHWAPMRPFLLD